MTHGSLLACVCLAGNCLQAQYLNDYLRRIVSDDSMNSSAYPTAPSAFHPQSPGRHPRLDLTMIPITVNLSKQPHTPRTNTQPGRRHELVTRNLGDEEIKPPSQHRPELPSTGQQP